MEMDPSAVKIWHAWVDLGEHLVFWNPYGAAVSLIFVGLFAGYTAHKIATDLKH